LPARWQSSWRDSTLGGINVTTLNRSQGDLAPSAAGPIDAADAPLPPLVPLSRQRTTLQLSIRQAPFVFRARNRFGDTFRVRSLMHDDPFTMTSHPDHVKSLMTARPEDAPSLTGESPLRPIVGPNSTLTALGERHMRQRKLHLPSFHGEAVARYSQMIAEAAEKEVDSWRAGDVIELAPRMQSVTLDVIMAGVFGVDGTPAPGTPERGLRTSIRRVTEFSTTPLAQLGELVYSGQEEPVGAMKLVMGLLDRYVYAVIAARRADPDADARNDILSNLMRATTEEGEHLTDTELRDELLTLVLAGHETTANQLAWTFERLVRAPEALDTLTSAVRSGDDAEAWIDATIHESMRSRPVIPIIGRRVTKPWRLGEYALPADSKVLVSILLLQHRDDLYPDPFAFRPERFYGVKPGTYTWIPFGGGIRRCLGAALAMAEQRIVLETIVRRCDIEAADPEPEHAKHRNVTMIPARGARVRTVSVT
jgi:cytochrome P450